MVAIRRGKGRGRPRTDPTRRYIDLGEGTARVRAVLVSANPEWWEWLSAFAQKKGLDVPELLGESLAYYAGSESYTAPPGRSRKSRAS